MAARNDTGRFRPPPSQSPAASTAAERNGSARRVDAAHADGPKRRRAFAGPGAVAESPESKPAADSLLPAHADDLVRHLQAWASVLDRRESELNAGIALQENRERSFRLWAQTQQEQLLQLEREALRLREELKQHARRLALTSDEKRDPR